MPNTTDPQTLFSISAGYDPQSDTPAGIPEWGDASQMFTLSQTLIQETGAFVTALEDAAANIFPPVINPSFPSINTPPVPIEATPPDIEVVSWAVPTEPAAFLNTLNVTNIMPGPFAGVSPTLVFGAQPAAFAGVEPTAPNVDTNFIYPTVIPPTLPTAPTLMTLDTVNFNPLVIPTFDIDVPTLVLSPPSVFNYSERAFYTSNELTVLEDSLTSAMTDGTDTGLSPAVLAQQWDAMRERGYRQQADTLAALDRDFEVLGYALPPGSYFDARMKVYTETNYTLESQNREIAIKNAEMHLDNVMKSREMAVNLEGKLIEYYNQISQRSFDAAKYTVESAVTIYNAQVEMYGKQLDGYRTQSMVYETQLKGVQAQIDYYNAQIAFEKTKADIDVALVQAYKTEVDAALAYLQVYQVQVDIIKTEAEVEKLKIDLFNGQIQAFVGQVNAYTAQIEAYKTNVEAQGTIEQVYKTEVDAYAAEVNAATSVINAQVAEYRAQIEAYTAQIEGYKAALQAMVEQARAASLYNQSEVAVYEGEVRANSAYNEALISEWKAIVDTNERVAEVAIKAAEANGQLYISARQLSLDAAKVGAQVMAQLGAAALNAIHWSNTSNWSLSSSGSVSTSVSTSTSTVNENIASV